MAWEEKARETPSGLRDGWMKIPAQYSIKLPNLQALWESAMAEKIGFIGLGIMGRSMAANLMNKTGDLVVWNRTASKAEDLVEEGAWLAKSPEDLASRCQRVFLCVSDTLGVESIVFGEEGLLESLQPGSIVVDCSTISPIKTREIASRMAEKQVIWLDAPVSGGSEGAKKGTLSIMVGGEGEAVEKVRPLLEAMGGHITHVGPTGTGQMAKLVNQVLVGVGMLALGEAFLLARAGGLDLQKTLEAIEQGAAGSWALSNRGPQVIARDWRPGFMIDLQQKDLLLVEEAARELGVPAPGTALVSQLYADLQQQGLGSEGNHALIKALEKMRNDER